MGDAALRRAADARRGGCRGSADASGGCEAAAGACTLGRCSVAWRTGTLLCCRGTHGGEYSPTRYRNTLARVLLFRAFWFFHASVVPLPLPLPLPLTNKPTTRAPSSSTATYSYPPPGDLPVPIGHGRAQGAARRARQVVEHPGDRCAPYAVHGAQRSQHERAHVHLGRREKQGAATSLDGGGDGKADLMRGLSSRSSCGGACDSSSIQSAARCPKAGHSTLSKGGFISASTTR